MSQRGFTLLELLIAVSIVAIVLAMGAPSLSLQIQRNRIAAARETLYTSIQLARATAVSRNQRVTLRNLGDWESGWEVFADTNSNGQRDDGELRILSSAELDSVSIDWNDPAGDYVSFTGIGVSRRVNGALQMGTFRICPLEGADGYALTLAPSGRVRSSRLNDC